MANAISHSGRRYVSWSNTYNQWLVSVPHLGKQKTLGRYTDLQKAIDIVDEWERTGILPQTPAQIARQKRKDIEAGYIAYLALQAEKSANSKKHHMTRKKEERQAPQQQLSTESGEVSQDVLARAHKGLLKPDEMKDLPREIKQINRRNRKD